MKYMPPTLISIKVTNDPDLDARAEAAGVIIQDIDTLPGTDEVILKQARRAGHQFVASSPTGSDVVDWAENDDAVLEWDVVLI